MFNVCINYCYLRKITKRPRLVVDRSIRSIVLHTVFECLDVFGRLEAESTNTER